MWLLIWRSDWYYCNLFRKQYNDLNDQDTSSKMHWLTERGQTKKNKNNINLISRTWSKTQFTKSFAKFRILSQVLRKEYFSKRKLFSGEMQHTFMKLLKEGLNVVLDILWIFSVYLIPPPVTFHARHDTRTKPHMTSLPPRDLIILFNQ